MQINQTLSTQNFRKPAQWYMILGSPSVSGGGAPSSSCYRDPNLGVWAPKHYAQCPRAYTVYALGKEETRGGSNGARSGRRESVLTPNQQPAAARLLFHSTIIHTHLNCSFSFPAPPLLPECREAGTTVNHRRKQRHVVACVSTTEPWISKHHCISSAGVRFRCSSNRATTHQSSFVSTRWAQAACSHQARHPCSGQCRAQRATWQWLLARTSGRACSS